VISTISNFEDIKQEKTRQNFPSIREYERRSSCASSAPFYLFQPPNSTLPAQIRPLLHPEHAENGDRKLDASLALGKSMRESRLKTHRIFSGISRLFKGNSLDDAAYSDRMDRLSTIENKAVNKMRRQSESANVERGRVSRVESHRNSIDPIIDC
jgi:hypothetical protein